MRTGSVISLRTRHAAQLDPALPWQLISIAKVDALGFQITERLALALAEQSRLKQTYSYADSVDRKALGIQREAIDEIVMRLQTFSERLTKYEQLIGLLNDNAYLSVRLSVAWPEGAPLAEQTLFSTAVTVADSHVKPQ